MRRAWAHPIGTVTHMTEVGRARLSSARRNVTGSHGIRGSRRAEDRRALPLPAASNGTFKIRPPHQLLQISLGTGGGIVIGSLVHGRFQLAHQVLSQWEIPRVLKMDVLKKTQNPLLPMLAALGVL